MAEIIRIQYYQSPCGELVIGSYGDRLCLCNWQKNEKRRNTIDERIRKGLQAQYIVSTSEIIKKTIEQLNEYFDNRRKVFDVPLLFVGTDFQKSVWNELSNIPYGRTASYAELSQRLSNPKAVRAVAAANGANAISIFVPCHRIIGSNHALTGYGGGLEAKSFLLRLESQIK